MPLDMNKTRIESAGLQCFNGSVPPWATEVLVVGSSHIRRMLDVTPTVNFPPEYRITYVGVSGMHLYQVRNMFDEENEHWGNPKAIIIATLGNDIGRNQETESYVQMYSDLANHIIANSRVTPLVYVCSPMYRDRCAPNYNTFVSMILRRRRRNPAPFARMAPAHLIHLPLRELQDQLLPEGIHLSYPGYKVFRDALDNYINSQIVAALE